MTDILKDATDRMAKSYKLLQDNFLSLWTTNSGGWIDTLKVEYYGSMNPIRQLASITVPYSGKFVIKPHDPACTKEIERAIHKANLGVTVAAEKNSVMVSVPSPTIQQREAMAEHAIHMANDAKVAVRKIRQDARTKLKKAKLSEDDEKRIEKKLPVVTILHEGEIFEAIFSPSPSSPTLKGLVAVSFA
jgi:ribosome recycling factor